MYPEGHPYRWSVIGSMADLSAASLEDVKSFFRQYYAPNNAILALAGDFRLKAGQGVDREIFWTAGKVGQHRSPEYTGAEAPGEVRKTYEESGIPLPKDVHGVAQRAASIRRTRPALDMLASILSTGRGSRLQSNLVYGKELAQQANASDQTSEIDGLFQITVSAKPGKSLDDIEKEINAEIERIKKEPPTAEEMRRALNVRESSAIFGLQLAAQKGARMASYAGFLNKPDYFQADIDRISQGDRRRSSSALRNQYLKRQPAGDELHSV
jgi:zinc protease